MQHHRGAAAADSEALGGVVLNVGLPRTGTTSFLMAAASVGLQVRQAVPIDTWCYDMMPFDELRTGVCTELVSREKDHACRSGVQFKARRRFPEQRHLHQYTAFADAPMHLLDAPSFQYRFPRAAVVCTTRSMESWLNSILSFIRKHSRLERKAWGQIWKQHLPAFDPLKHNFSEGVVPGLLLHDAVRLGFASKHLLSRASISWSTHLRPALERLWDWHDHLQCPPGVPRINVYAPDATKWRVLCEAVGHARVNQESLAACLEVLKGGQCWPTSNGLSALNPAINHTSRQPRATCPVNCLRHAASGGGFFMGNRGVKRRLCSGTGRALPL